MASFADLVRFIPTLGGTTDWIYSSAVGGCQSPSAANVQNGIPYKVYSVSTDLSQWEISQGVYNSSTGTFPRTTVLYNSSGSGTALGQSGAGTKINFTTVPQVSIIAVVEDFGELSTGDAKLTFKTTADNGWVMMNDGTIGDASSSASNRANADTQPLFNLFYTFADADCPLLTSAGGATTRGAQGTAAAAYAAHCRMTLPKQLGQGIAVSGAGAGLTARTLGHADGAETKTIAAGNLPAHAHPITDVTHSHGTTEAAHGHGIGLFYNDNTGTTYNYTGYYALQKGVGIPSLTNTTGLSINSSYSGITTTQNYGAGTAIDVMNPRTYWNVMVKL